ncbi:MAG: integrase family protein [Candidatus Accumulibacter phosphatis]|uniref:integrase arm-type DNA-binding domain-containing protein n=1 Tax=Candidatus Accumulibacter phosphatis TaxID=327160 RepID=UPI001A5FE3BE|nr:integrase family protein [Candidatus Accumulibacter phosphatis]
MNRERLTPDRIRGLAQPTGTGQFFTWDTDAPRLAVRVTAGAKSFIFESKLNRQTVRVTIGDTRAWTLAAARDEARRLQVLIDSGVDPRAAKREREAEAARLIAESAAGAAALVAEAEAAKREQEKRERYTLRTLCEAYCDLLQARGKPSARQARSILKVHVFEAHPEIAATPARDVTPLQVAAMVRQTREAGRERAAGVLRSYLSAAFTAGKKAPFDASLPAALIPFEIERNPVDAIPAIGVRAGNRTLSADELRAYLAELGDNLADQALLLALLAGGQRMAQLLRVKVADYDPDTATLRLWDGKGRRTSPREHVLPLAPRAAALVAGLVDRARAKDSALLFSTHGAVQLDETTPGKRAAAIAAGMHGEPFDLRDIRRTCETMLAGLGISRDTRAQLLSHGIGGVQATHYDRHGYIAEKRAALMAWEDRLQEIATGTARSNVVPMKQKSVS